MSVELHTDRADTAADGPALAGSGPINAVNPAQDDADTPLGDPGANAGQDGSTKRRSRGPAKPKPGVLLICSRCHRTIVGSGAGYAYVNLVDAHKAAQRTAAGYIDPAKARWTLAHRGCAPEALAPMSAYHVVWAENLSTVDALLGAMVRLSFSAWFAWSDWGALARDILADTETVALHSAARAEADIAAHTRQARIEAAEARVAARREQRRQHREAKLREAQQRKIERAARRPAPPEAMRRDPTDPRHGTTNGYANCACRCDRCREASTTAARTKRAKANP
jgi:hypothetical protein